MERIDIEPVPRFGADVAIGGTKIQDPVITGVTVPIGIIVAVFTTRNIVGAR